MRKYQVYGDYGYENETLLGNFDDKLEAVAWAVENYEDNLGDYRIVDVAFFDNGEYIPVHVIRQH